MYKRVGPEDHRGLSSTLYMVKPSNANTVAPTLARSQKVELFGSAWLICLLTERVERYKYRDQVKGGTVLNKDIRMKIEMTKRWMKELS